MGPRLRILLSLGLGTATTIAVAWAFALWPGNTGAQTSIWNINDHIEEPRRSIRLMREGRAGRHWDQFAANWQNPEVNEPWRLGPDLRPDIQASMEAFPLNRSEPGAHPRGTATSWPGWPEWPSWLPNIPRAPDGLVAYGGRASGWPLFALRSISASHNARVAESQDWQALDWAWSWRLVPQDVYPQSWDPELGSVPLQPIPLNFALDTLLFAASWWLLIGGPRDVRRWWRICHGLCPFCGYSTSGLAASAPCPECGQSQAAPSTLR